MTINQKLKQYFINPIHPVDDHIKEVKLQLLSKFLFLTNIVAFILIFVMFLDSRLFIQGNLEAIIALSFVSLLILSYILARFSKYHISAALFTLGLSFSTFLIVSNTLAGNNPSYNPFDVNGLLFLVIPLLFNSLFFEAKPGLVLNSINLIGMLTIPVLFPHITFFDILLGPFTLYLIVFLMQSVISHHHDGLELQRQKIVTKQNKELKELDEIKNNFLKITSHELRTPMTAIRGHAEMLSMGIFGNMTKDQLESLETIQRNTIRLDRIVDEIMDIETIQKNKIQLSLKSTDLKDAIRQSIETIDVLSKEKNIRINTSFSSNLKKIEIDEKRIIQVVTNLIENAIKNSPINSNIYITAESLLDNIQVTVEDQGRGIPKKQQKRIFDVFYQIDSYQDREVGGAGIGLAICKGIVEAHNGNIQVESQPGKGSKFTILLPYETPIQPEFPFEDKISMVQ